MPVPTPDRPLYLSPNERLSERHKTRNEHRVRYALEALGEECSRCGCEKNLRIIGVNDRDTRHFYSRSDAWCRENLDKYTPLCLGCLYKRRGVRARRAFYRCY